MENVLDYSSPVFLPEIKKAVADMGFTEMTEVQQKAIPPALEGRDITAKAPTGTGKTCAFGIPLIQRVNTEQNTVQSVILCPTRELCLQIWQELKSLAKYLPDVKIACVYGGENINRQITALQRGAHIVVATPGRLLDHMKRRTVDLRSVTAVVLDEADEMLDMGFYKDVKYILDSLKNKKQVMMFSATISREVMDIGWLYQRDAAEITVLPVEESMPKIEQFSLATTARSKLADMSRLIIGCGYKRVMVFCNTKFTTAMVCDKLCENGFKADCLHGDMTQRERNRIMQAFRADKFDILVATDVAARGIDISDIEVVINYDIPESNDYYLHRIGRTGRARREGVSYILTMPDEITRVRNLVRITKSDITPVKLGEDNRPIKDDSVTLTSGVEIINILG